MRRDLDDFGLERKIVAVDGESPEDADDDYASRIERCRTKQEHEGADAKQSEPDECQIVPVIISGEEPASDDSHDAESGKNHGNPAVGKSCDLAEERFNVAV